VLSKRPVYLNLLTIRLPIPALVSILHRMSGVILFISLPMLIGLLEKAVRSEQDFTQAAAWLQLFWVKGLIWMILISWVYHVLAGVRHLLLDIEIADSLFQARVSSYIVLGLTISISVVLGCWLW